jgi:phosphoribosylanthranilate isomerase
MLVKICGITSIEDAEAAVEAGASSLGFVFWPKSPRFIDPHRARAIVSSLPPFVVSVGVFVNQPAAHVKGVACSSGWARCSFTAMKMCYASPVWTVP